MKEILLKVVKNRKVVNGVYKIDLLCPEKLDIKGGQFLNIQVPDESLILRRPFCIYDYIDNTISLLYATIGKGTHSLAKAKRGQKLSALLPLGNGFDVFGYKRVGLLGGGMGAAALNLVAALNPKVEFSAYLGFASKDRALLFEEGFKRNCKKVITCTSDGSYGIKGYATGHLIADLNNLDAVFICGPTGLVKSVQNAPELKNKPVFVSMEQHMACGIGACLVCTCAHNDGTNKRVCADGPVFKLDDVVL